MGQRVTVGALTYNVQETKWDLTLGTAPNVRTPQRQFLMVRLSVTNGGGAPSGFPLLAVLTESGKRHVELEDTRELEEPIGLIRTIQPGETEIGWILFDLPQDNYLLEVTDGKIENEHSGLVELPLRLT